MAEVPRIHSIASGGGSVVLGDVRLKDGTFIGRDQINHYYRRYVTQVFSPTIAESSALSPFVGERPFHTNDRTVYTNRQTPLTEVLDNLRDPDRPAAVIYGPSDVGKTSFVSAGVLPQLPFNGAEVIPMRDYCHATPLLRALLHGRAVQLGGAELAEDLSLADLTRTLLTVTPRHLILVLDQFERFFTQDVGDDEREAFQDGLAAMLAVAEPGRLRVLIAIRDDWKTTMDRQWEAILPGLQLNPAYLGPLTEEEAERAILGPVQKLGRLPAFDPSLVRGPLLDDLIDLSSESSQGILPAELQLVCHRLYTQAQGMTGVQVINAPIYKTITAGRGAEGLLEDHFEGLWARIEGPKRELAREIAERMLTRGWQNWVEAQELPVESRPQAAVDDVLEEMAEAGILIWHLAGDHRAYAFASYSTSQAVERILGSPVQKRRQARNELKYAWRDWTVDDQLAAAYQLNLIEDYYQDAPLPPKEALLLLRSAITREMPADPWISHLNTDMTQEAIRTLEMESTASATPEETAYWRLARLLGMDDEGMPARPPKSTQDFGGIAWAAAAHPQPSVRETAALALKQAEPKQVLKRLIAAVRAGDLGRRRLAELRAILADAGHDPDAEGWGDGLARFETWLQRFGRRIHRDWGQLWRLAVGGGVGAGLALSALRAVMALLMRTGEAGRYFYSSFPMGFLLGGALSLGLFLVSPLRLVPQRERQPTWATVGMGTLCFALAHPALLALFNPRLLIEGPLIPPMSVLAGMALSVVVHDQPKRGWRPGLSGGGRALRLLIVAVLFAGMQTIFVRTAMTTERPGGLGGGLMFAWQHAFYRSMLPNMLERWNLRALGDDLAAIPNAHYYAAVIDAALTGIALAWGLTRGLISADRHIRRRSTLIRHADV